MSVYFGQYVMRRSQVSQQVFILAALCTVGCILTGSLLLFAHFKNSNIPLEPTLPSSMSLSIDPPVEVLVPVVDLTPDRPLEPRLFKKEFRSRSSVSNKIVRGFEQIQGMFVKSFVVAGEPLHMDYIVANKSSAPIASSIPKGFVAVAIQVNDASGAVDGFARPGERVDVSWLHTLNGQPAHSVILQSVEVLAADRNITPDWKAGMPVPGTFTLLVSADDRQRIELASNTGNLRLSLRGTAGVGTIQGEAKTITKEDVDKDGKDKNQEDKVCRDSGRIEMCKNGKECRKYCLTMEGELRVAPPQGKNTNFADI